MVKYFWEHFLSALGLRIPYSYWNLIIAKCLSSVCSTLLHLILVLGSSFSKGDPLAIPAQFLPQLHLEHCSSVSFMTPLLFLSLGLLTGQFHPYPYLLLQAVCESSCSNYPTPHCRTPPGPHRLLKLNMLPVNRTIFPLKLLSFLEFLW